MLHLCECHCLRLKSAAYENLSFRTAFREESHPCPIRQLPTYHPFTG
jgi:hypothetical protein